MELQYKDSSIAVEPPDEKGFIEGYASVYGVVDHQNERTLPGAFDRAIKNPRRIKLLWQDKFEQPIGKITKLWEDERGLRFRGKLNLKTDWGRNAYEALLAGDVSANSIGYNEISGKNAINDEDGVKDLNELDLWEISTVSFPSNEAATVDEVKGIGESIEPVAIKPYPSEHACRLREPSAFEDNSFRRVTRDSDGKRYSVIMGKLKGETTMTEQAYRYPKDVWGAAAAKAHCSSHDGASFEAAVSESSVTPEQVKAGRVLSSANEADLRSAAEAMANAVTAINTVLGRGAPKEEAAKELTNIDELLIKRIQRIKEIME